VEQCSIALFFLFYCDLCHFIAFSTSRFERQINVANSRHPASPHPTSFPFQLSNPDAPYNDQCLCAVLCFSGERMGCGGGLNVFSSSRLENPPLLYVPRLSSLDRVEFDCRRRYSFCWYAWLVPFARSNCARAASACSCSSRMSLSAEQQILRCLMLLYVEIACGHHWSGYYSLWQDARFTPYAAMLQSCPSCTR